MKAQSLLDAEHTPKLTSPRKTAKTTSRPRVLPPQPLRKRKQKHGKTLHQPSIRALTPVRSSQSFAPFQGAPQLPAPPLPSMEPLNEMRSQIGLPAFMPHTSQNPPRNLTEVWVSVTSRTYALPGVLKQHTSPSVPHSYFKNSLLPSLNYPPLLLQVQITSPILCFATSPPVLWNTFSSSSIFLGLPVIFHMHGNSLTSSQFSSQPNQNPPPPPTAQFPSPHAYQNFLSV